MDAPAAIDTASALFDAAGVGLCLLDARGTVVRANAEWLRSGGFTPDAAIGRHIWDLFPATPPELRRIHDDVRAGRTIEVPEHPQRVDGREVWYEGRLAPVRLDDGVGILVTAIDITDRKRAEAALRGSEQKCAAIFDLAPFAIALTRLPDRTIVSANEAFLRLFEYRREEVIGRTSVDLRIADPESQARVAAELAERGCVRDHEATRMTRSGVPRVVSMNLDLVALEGERYVVSVLQDVTARARAEEALREASRRKDEFLATLSHELRNPLAPIRNSIHLLEQAAPGSERARRAREVLRRQTEHLTRLVDDLLDATRISSGKVSLQRSRVDLRDLVVRTTDDVRSAFEERAIDLRVERVAGPVWIDADPTRIAQAVGNLLENAVKFTPIHGNVSVRVAASEGRATVTVRDDGLGMEPAQIERMFEPFAQAEQGIARTRGGLGLGLALVKGLVELHRGSVRARSDGIGQGAELVITLPLAEAPVPGAEDGPPAFPDAARTLVVIEDNADAAQTLAELLELEGHRVRVARDGRSGIALVREARPDLVLCDVGLPDVDGYEVARTLRADEAMRSVRLVALSGYAQPEDRARARAAGFDAHLAKPPTLEQLLQAIAEAPARPR